MASTTPPHCTSEGLLFLALEQALVGKARKVLAENEVTKRGEGWVLGLVHPPSSLSSSALFTL